jgi:hypothetical protein
MTMSNHRIRIALFSIFTLACVAATIGYVRWRVTRPAMATGTPLLDPADSTVQATIDAMRSSSHLAFLSSRSDAFGRIGLATLGTPADTSILGGPECERAHFGKELGLCLVLNRDSMEPRSFALILDRHYQTLARFPLAGLPIRARVSRDQRFAAATVFVTGESYASDFTTRTTIIDLTTRKALANLEEFSVERDGRPFRSVDFNFWGVTFFQDGNRFFATLGTNGTRLLVEGNIERRSMRVVRDDVECPSLSPDELHIVFKRQLSRGGGWRLWASDVGSGESWPITDDGQDIDDQVEWLDNDRVIYGRLFGDGVPENSLSLWVTPITRQATFDQQLFLRSASSPSVVR